MQNARQKDPSQMEAGKENGLFSINYGPLILLILKLPLLRIYEIILCEIDIILCEMKMIIL